MVQGFDELKFFCRFQSEEDCKHFLYSLKWRNGFCCKRCGGREFWKGRTQFHARCVICGYDESLTANTIFHKLHIPLRKAFSIVFHLTEYKKGISTLDLSRMIKVSQKSVWLMKRKLQDAMGKAILAESKKEMNFREAIIDGINLSHSSDNTAGLQRIHFLTGTSQGAKRISRIRHCIAGPDPDVFNSCNLVGGKYVDEKKDILNWSFRVWLTGVHHHCSRKYLQGYLDEFNFRLNFRHPELNIWYKLMEAVMCTKPYVYKQHAAKG